MVLRVRLGGLRAAFARSSAGRRRQHAGRVRSPFHCAPRDFLDDRHRVLAGHGRAEMEQVKENRAERADVAARIERVDLPASLLGGDGLRRAHDRTGQGAGEVGNRKWEIGKTCCTHVSVVPTSDFPLPTLFASPQSIAKHLAEVAEHDVLRLEVASAR